MSIGWIKVDRSIMDNTLWKSTSPFDVRSAWIDLLLMANFTDGEMHSRGRVQKIKRGQLHTSVIELANRWRWSRNKVRRYLSLLEAEGMITQNGAPNGTTLTLVKYEVYQGWGQTDETPNETPNESSNGTTDESTDGTPNESSNGTRYKKDKKGKEELRRENKGNKGKNNKAYFPNDEKLNSAFADYVDTRKKIKSPMTDRAVDLAISKLMKLSNGDNDTAIEILNNSIVNGWKGLYPLKETKKQETTINWEDL